MKKNLSIYVPLFLLLALGLESCEVIGDIFKAGVWVGVILVILVVGIILWIVGKAKK